MTRQQKVWIIAYVEQSKNGNKTAESILQSMASLTDAELDLNYEQMYNKFPWWTTTHGRDCDGHFTPRCWKFDSLTEAYEQMVSFNEHSDGTIMDVCDRFTAGVYCNENEIKFES